MKRSRRTPSHSTKRDGHDIFVAQTVSAQEDSSACSADQVRKTAENHVPLSLKTGAGRQHWDEVLRLLVKIRTDCDAAAERLGYPSTKDDGLAAVEYIANNILEAVQGERQRQRTSAKARPATRPPKGSDPSFTEYETTYEPEKKAQRAIHSERSKLIDELKQMLRDGKTKSGIIINPQLAHEIAKQITILNEGIVQPETAVSIKEIKETIAPFFANLHGKRKKISKAPAVATRENPKRVKSPSSHAEKAVTRGSKRRSR